MNEKKKFRIIAMIGIACIILITILAIIENENTKKELEKFNQYFSSETVKLIYFGKDDCYYCQLLQPAKKQLLDDNNIDYYYVDSKLISKSLLDKMLDKLNITEFGTPTLVIVKENTVINIQSGVFSTTTDNVTELTEYLKTHGIIEETK